LLLLAIRPHTEADQARLARGIQSLLAEDPTISAKNDPATGEVVVGAMGELQLEVTLDRLRADFNVEASLSRPQVAYKETVTRDAAGDVRLARQVGGRRMYAHVTLRIEPGEPGSGCMIANEIVDGAVPREFFQPIEEGIREAIARGVLAGYPVDDVHVVVCDGSHHDGDSSAMAFKLAASMAFDDAARKAQPVVIEPVMHVEVTIPIEDMDHVIRDLTSRRGQIKSHDDCDGMRRVAARVPLSQMFGYAAHLRDRTRGRGTFAMQFASYQPCDPPENQADDSTVGAPRTPSPSLLDSSVALPEPINDDRRE
jgi:elongation factor G